MGQGRLFDPDNPPQAFSKAEGNARLAEIKAELRSRPGWYRYDDLRSRIMEGFHDRRRRESQE